VDLRFNDLSDDAKALLRTGMQEGIELLLDGITGLTAVAHPLPKA
jgi:hypothetical protein